MSRRNWNTQEKNGQRLVVCLFTSRNKDNEGVENFKERRKSFLAYEGSPHIEREFKHFVEDGVPGETSRWYESLNARDPEKAKKQLMIHLIENDDGSEIAHLNSVIVSIAAKKECAAEKKWLIDFDSRDDFLLASFIYDVKEQMNKDCRRSKKHLNEDPEITAKKTPNGYAVITPYGFYSQEILKYYKCAELKKDGMLFMDIKKNESKKE